MQVQDIYIDRHSIRVEESQAKALAFLDGEPVPLVESERGGADPKVMLCNLRTRPCPRETAFLRHAHLGLGLGHRDSNTMPL